jgi:TonB family protein
MKTVCLLLSVSSVLLQAAHGDPTPPVRKKSQSTQTDIVKWQESFRPHMIFAAYPRYPYAAKLAKSEGRGLFDLHVASDGTISTVDVFRSTGHKILNEEAVRVLLSWKFRPDRKWTRVRVPIAFTLGRRPDGPALDPTKWPW